MVLPHLLSLSVFFSIASAAVRFVSDDALGSIFHLDSESSKHYFVPLLPTREVNVIGRATDALDNFTPATSLRVRSSPLSRKFLDAQFDAYRHIDDVWNDKFLNTLLVSFQEGFSNFQGSKDPTAFFDDSGIDWLIEHDVRNLYITNGIQRPEFKKKKMMVDINIQEINEVPPHGPWLLRTPKANRNAIYAYPVYGLFPDNSEAFTVGILPDPEDSKNGVWISTNLTLPENPDVQYIPVPSRLAAFSGHKKPLAGLRFGLKDIFHVKGLPTAAGSSAYQRVYGKQNTTALAVQRLLDLGATLIGKTRTSQFAHGAQPWEFIDVPYSWNPRGDGYLTASASSSGSACAIAAYDWVDFTVGSDTRGSVRKPAALVGAYGIRPSLGAIGLEGVLPVSEEMDTAGFFARDPTIFESIANNWYADAKVIEKSPRLRLPKQIFYPIDHFPVANPEAQEIYERFAKQLRKHLNIVTKPVNLTELLTPFFPNRDFAALQAASNKLVEYHSWHAVGKPLAERLQSHDGDEVGMSLDPVPQRSFALGRTYSKRDYKAALQVKRTFARAMAEQFFHPDSKSCADSLFMYDAGTGGKPSYRIEELNTLHGAVPSLLTKPLDLDTPAQAKDFFNFVASMGDLPEITIPLGQVSYWSQVSRQWEMVPVAVQLVTRKGCDGALWDLVKKLGERHVLETVKTGKTAF